MSGLISDRSPLAGMYCAIPVCGAGGFSAAGGILGETSGDESWIGSEYGVIWFDKELSSSVDDSLEDSSDVPKMGEIGVGFRCWFGGGSLV